MLMFIVGDLANLIESNSDRLSGKVIHSSFTTHKFKPPKSISESSIEF